SDCVHCLFFTISLLSSCSVFCYGLCCRCTPHSPTFFFNATATTEIYTLSLHDALPISHLEGLRRQLDDAKVLYELAESENDAASLVEVGAEITALAKAISELETRTMLSGEYDARDAVVAVRAGAGGVDAADFAEMLLRMYLRWAERHGYPTEIYDISYAEEAGIKSATFVVKAPYAYGTLSVEAGTHRLVRIS